MRVGACGARRARVAWIGGVCGAGGARDPGGVGREFGRTMVTKLFCRCRGELFTRQRVMAR